MISFYPITCSVGVSTGQMFFSPLNTVKCQGLCFQFSAALKPEVKEIDPRRPEFPNSYLHELLFLLGIVFIHG